MLYLLVDGQFKGIFNVSILFDMELFFLHNCCSKHFLPLKLLIKSTNWIIHLFAMCIMGDCHSLQRSSQDDNKYLCLGHISFDSRFLFLTSYSVSFCAQSWNHPCHYWWQSRHRYSPWGHSGCPDLDILPHTVLTGWLTSGVSPSCWGWILGESRSWW